jgi:hypothetical protein
MHKLPPRCTRSPWLLASSRVVRLAALSAVQGVSQVPGSVQRATRRWRRSKARVKAKKVFRWLLLILFFNILGWVIASRI